VIGVYNKGEGILIPRGFKYWFESASPQALEIIRVGAPRSNQGIAPRQCRAAKGLDDARRQILADPAQPSCRAAVSRPMDR
jgi:hypothetical protein